MKKDLIKFNTVARNNCINFMDPILEDDLPGSDEEDILIYCEFDGFLDEDLVKSNTFFKIIGIDTDQPMLQIHNQIYQGKHDDACGTYVLFENDKNPKARVQSANKKSPSTYVKYVAKTEKILHMKRVFLTEKNNDHSKEIVDLNYQFPETYKDALNRLTTITMLNDEPGSKSGN